MSPETRGRPEHGPDTDPSVEFTDTYRAATKVRLSVRGRTFHLSHEAANIVAQDSRYLRYVTVVAPWDWAAAANDPRLTIEAIEARLVGMGYGLDALRGAVPAEPVEEEPPVYSFEAELRQVERKRRKGEALTEHDQLVLETAARRDGAPKPRPAVLDGIRHSQGNSDRPSRRPETRRRKYRRIMNRKLRVPFRQEDDSDDS